MSNFRTICVAALAAPLLLLVTDAAVAQNATAAGQSGKILAGLRPPHEHHKVATAKTGPAKPHHDAATKVARKPAKRRSVVTASSTAEVPRRVAKHLNSRVANSRIANSRITWQGVEPAAAEETSTPQTALQFATEDTASNATLTPATAIATTAKAKTVATDERKVVDSAADNRPTTTKMVQTERFEAPAPSQMSNRAPTETLSQMPGQMPNEASSPAPTQTLIAAPARQEMIPANRASSTASILVTLAGAITAGLVGWLMFGFGSARTVRVSREPATAIRYLPFVPLR